MLYICVCCVCVVCAMCVCFVCRRVVIVRLSVRVCVVSVVCVRLVVSDHDAYDCGDDSVGDVIVVVLCVLLFLVFWLLCVVRWCCC